MKDPNAGSRRGQVWFAVQSAIALAWVLAPMFSHAPFSLAIRAAGGAIFLAGIAVLVVSYRALGRSHSPWTTPVAGGKLVMTGPYRCVRHPVYAAFVVIGLGLQLALASPLGLVVVLVAFVYYDLRAREEERWLSKRYPEFDAYRVSVRGRLIPALC